MTGVSIFFIILTTLDSFFFFFCLTQANIPIKCLVLRLACFALIIRFRDLFCGCGWQLLDQGNSLPQLEEGLKLSLSDNDKITTLLEEVKAQVQIIQEKVDKRVEQERRLKVRTGKKRKGDQSHYRGGRGGRGGGTYWG